MFIISRRTKSVGLKVWISREFGDPTPTHPHSSEQKASSPYPIAPSALNCKVVPSKFNLNSDGP